MIRVVAGLLLLTSAGWAGDGAGPPPAPTHRVALVDIGYLFKNYRKFEAQTASLRERIEQADAEARAGIERLREIEARLQGGLQEAELAPLTTEFRKLQTDLDAARQRSQRELLVTEAQIYKSAYLEVQDAVRQYARHYGYTLVLQFTRPDLDAATTARDILDQLNNPVVYFSGRDDVSDPILQYLNDRWSGRPSTPPSSAGANP